MITPGQYDMRCVDIGLSETKGGEGKESKPQIACIMQVTEGPHAGTDVPWYGFFTEKTEKSTILALRTLGWKGDDLTDLSECIGGQASCKVEVEADLEGTPRARVRFIGGGLQVQKMAPDKAAAFAMAMKAKIAPASNGKAEPKKAFGFK